MKGEQKRVEEEEEKEEVILKKGEETLGKLNKENPRKENKNIKIKKNFPLVKDYQT